MTEQGRVQSACQEWDSVPRDVQEVCPVCDHRALWHDKNGCRYCDQSGRVPSPREDAAMTPKQVLHAEIVKTLTLGQGRGESVEDQAWDVLHELLEVGSDGIDRAAAVLLAVRQAWR